MKKVEIENLKLYFGVLKSRMKSLDEDCAEPATKVDEGYHIAVEHMNCEIDRMILDLDKQAEVKNKYIVWIKAKLYEVWKVMCEAAPFIIGWELGKWLL